jgi:hypothetical protein
MDTYLVLMTEEEMKRFKKDKAWEKKGGVFKHDKLAEEQKELLRVILQMAAKVERLRGAEINKGG